MSTWRALGLLLLAPLAGLSAGAAHAAAGSYTDALAEGLDGVPLRCLTVQLREGADAYRNCVADAGDTDPSTTGQRPSFDERYAAEQACVGADTAGSCLQAQLDALADAPMPSLDDLPANDRNAVLRQCADAPDGVAARGECLERAIADVEVVPMPGDGGTGALGALTLGCIDSGGSAADFRRCRLDELGPADTAPDGAISDTASTATQPEAPAAPDPEAPSDEPMSEASSSDVSPSANEPTLAADAGSTTAAIGGAADEAASLTADITDATGDDLAVASEAALSVDAAESPVVTAQSTPSTGAAEPLAEADDTPGPDLRERATDARDRLLETFSGMDGTQKMVLMAALALPLLLLGFWALGREREPEYIAPADEGPIRNAALVDRVAPSVERPGGSDYGEETSDEEFFAEIDNATGSGRRRGDHPPDERSDALARDRAAFAALDDDDDRGDRLHGREPAADRPDLDATVANVRKTPGAREADESDFAPGSGFGLWLSRREPGIRRQHAIEFLIYWMAYADERYEPAFAEALLRDGGQDGDPHDLIKRHVLEKDAPAFADVVRWIQSECSELERVQILDLLMVLLIGDGTMTPVQNTLLHFLADVFGLGADGLDQRHEEAFGQPMPALARVDLPVWWEQLEPGASRLWDARAIAALGRDDQNRVRLGLPLGGTLQDSRIVEAFRRAARRCQPHRFDALGERERALAERQFTKFEEARDRLLGVKA